VSVIRELQLRIGPIEGCWGYNSSCALTIAGSYGTILLVFFKRSFGLYIVLRDCWMYGSRCHEMQQCELN
jgi:hypothetical protein